MRIVIQFRLLLVALLFIIGINQVAANTASIPSLEGSWSGQLASGPDKPPIVFDIRRGPDGALLGFVRGFENGRVVYDIDTIELSGNTVKIVVGVAGGGFQGEISMDWTQLSGTWSELAIATPLVLTRLPRGADRGPVFEQ